MRDLRKFKNERRPDVELQLAGEAGRKDYACLGFVCGTAFLNVIASTTDGWDHVNVHNYCLHLWRPQNVDIPKPPNELVL